MDFFRSVGRLTLYHFQPTIIAKTTHANHILFLLLSFDHPKALNKDTIGLTL
jgi:hypothetical protein